MIKKLTLMLSLVSASTFAMSYVESGVQEVEERPSLGFYLEYGDLSSYKITYKEQNANHGGSAGIVYENTNLEVSPTLGFAGHIPFIWDKYMDATATVGFNKTKVTAKTTKTVNPNDLSEAISEPRQDRSFESFHVIIEGGPELGFPVYEDYETQQLLKPFVQARGMFIKTFNQTSTSNWQNDQAFGYAYVAGLRWSMERLSIGAGLRSEYVFWQPTYDPTAGDRDENQLYVEYTREFKPWVTIEWGFY